MQIYFQNNFISLSYDKALRLGKAQWRGRLHGAELREAYLLCHDMINRFSLARWLADDRLMGAITPADLEWSMMVHVPQMARSPLQRMARIPSQNEDNLEAVNAMINKGYTFDLPFEIRDFEDEQEAMKWLTEPIWAHGLAHQG